MKLIECVPNFSEGRNKSKIDEIIESIKESSQTTILDVDMGFDTNRTVMTIVGSPSEVLKGVFNGIKKASKIIDMRKHTGTHPRIGSTDVCPLIPIKNVSMEEYGSACVEFWCATAISKGIKIEVAHRSGLLDTNVPDNEKLYGYHRLEDPLVQTVKDGSLLITKQSSIDPPEPVESEPIIFGRHDHV